MVNKARDESTQNLTRLCFYYTNISCVLNELMSLLKRKAVSIKYFMLHRLFICTLAIQAFFSLLALQLQRFSSVQQHLRQISLCILQQSFSCLETTAANFVNMAI
ncbi:conserved hypothetical protein [Trichinella spiralis]|uniref:hypothetical protein n=1 Tax=Trichinella spiralis TaxID=6334 RepID=UPI0001EFD397|nr:conserved hypothetical protein [Trichinella spiralis]